MARKSTGRLEVPRSSARFLVVDCRSSLGEDVLSGLRRHGSLLHLSGPLLEPPYSEVQSLFARVGCLLLVGPVPTIAPLVSALAPAGSSRRRSLGLIATGEPDAAQRELLEGLAREGLVHGVVRDPADDLAADAALRAGIAWARRRTAPSTSVRLRRDLTEQLGGDAFDPGASLYAEVFRRSPSFDLILDEAGLIVEASSWALEVTGATIGDLRGRPLSYGPWWTAAPEALDALVEAARKDGEAEGDVELVSAQGEHLALTLILLGLTDEDEVIRAFSVSGRDITARVAAERSMRALNEELERRVEERTRELKAASKAKSEFLASMSHEIRTPLNAILGFVQLLQAEDDLRESQRQRLAIVHRSGEHLLGIIDDVLNMARIEAGRVELQPRPVAVGAMLRDLGHMFRLRAEERGLELEVIDRCPSKLVVDLDENKLRQVLINLLGNAMKFTEAGRVTLSAELRAVSNRVLELHAAVSDTGPGIAEADLADLFRPFVQADSARRVNGGTGLGLAISRKLVDLMGGELSAESQLGVGSTFRLRVPAARSAAVIPAGGESMTTRLRRLRASGPAPRALIVDDNRPNRELFEQLFRSVGFTVETARDGLEALTRWAEASPELVIMDLRMPGIDGFEAIQKLRSEGFAGRILALSASVTGSDRERALEAGADSFCSKPVTCERLLERACALLGVELERRGKTPFEVPRPPFDAPDGLSDRLPGELLARLRSAVLRGHLSAVEAAAEELLSAGEAGAELLESARSFDYEKLYLALDIDPNADDPQE